MGLIPGQTSSTQLHANPLLEGALHWLHANIDGFNPSRRSSEPALFGGIRLAELTLLCMCLRRVPAYSGLDQVGQLLRFVVPIYTEPVFRDRLFRNADEFPAHAMLTAALVACGAIDGPRYL